jgi:scyllo-inositol 2-dehydrogenase (NADP+)
MIDQPVRTAILSYGMSGEVFHAPLLNALPQFELYGVVQRRSDKASAHYPKTRSLRSVDEVLDDPTIELVIVNTPNETHFDFAARALLSGKHVVVEKPFTVTAEEARQLMALSVSVDRVLTVFQNRRWDSDFLTVRRILEQNLLGKIVEFEAHYDRFRNYIEPNTWKEERSPGTGILYNLGSHMLDQVLVLFGMPDYVDARIGAHRPGGKVDDFYDIRLEYPEHLAIVKSSYLVKEEMPRYIIHGLKGSFVKYGLDTQEQALKEKKDPNDPRWGTEPEGKGGKINYLQGTETVEERVPSEQGDYKIFYRDLYETIRNKRELEVKPSQALDVIRLIEACYESNKNKCAVRVGGKG